MSIPQNIETLIFSQYMINQSNLDGEGEGTLNSFILPFYFTCEAVNESKPEAAASPLQAFNQDILHIKANFDRNPLFFLNNYENGQGVEILIRSESNMNDVINYLTDTSDSGAFGVYEYLNPEWNP
jgi:hypothetical protein